VERYVDRKIVGVGLNVICGVNGVNSGVTGAGWGVFR